MLLTKQRRSFSNYYSEMNMTSVPVPTSFVHLRCHSEYSIYDSLIRFSSLTQKVVEHNMSAIAITDLGNMFGFVKFYTKALHAGIKPLIGAELWIENNSPLGYSKLIVLCQNNQGYHNLTKILSKGYLEGKRITNPIIPFEWVENAHEGLILLSGGPHGAIGQYILQEEMAQAKELLKSYLALWGDRFYLEIHRTERENESHYNQSVLKLASELQCPVVATNDVIMLQRSDFEAHQARIGIQQGTLLSSIAQNKNKFYSAQQYLKSSSEMIALFKDIPSAIANTLEIAKRCTVDLSLGQAFLPNFPVPENQTVQSYLESAAQIGLEKRFKVNTDNFKMYQERLEFELKVINSMGYPGYFLIVSDFIRWAKSQDIPVGPGRGSGAGSLVAYALEITDIDPLQYDLLFERFLNPERVSMPDFDVDFCMEGRDRVIEYVAKTYGRESVAQIVTFGTMAAKAVIRDVGRVLGHPYGFVDAIAKLIPFEVGMTLKKAMEQEETLLTRYKDEEEVQILLDLAKKLEGLTRNVGKHAGGVVIAPSKLTEFTPLYCEHETNHIVTQFDKDDIESIGLVKFDFLGLRTLTIIHWAVKNVNLIRDKQGLSAVNIIDIPLDDEPTYDLLRACSTTAIFQLESRGIKEIIHRLQPDSFEEIIALVALYRPGPLQSGMVDDFIDRKHGRSQVVYPHDDIIPILKPTYGVILYQEQVMQIAQVLAGYTLGAADLLRRAMGKKKAEEMAEQRQIFTQGAVERGVDEAIATSIFDLMEKFAGYGFNKSHSAAYALISYQTAWLKAHYPGAFMAAVLSADMGHTDKVVIFIEECKAMHLNVMPPNINASEYKFILDDQNNIMYGLGAIKGVGEGAIASILEERQYGKYLDVFDFCRRVDLRKVNRRVLDALVRSGAMDSFVSDYAGRSSLLASLDNAVKSSEQFQKNKQRGQSDLFFAMSDEIHPAQPLEERLPWSDKERLRGEKETLGLYLTGHPIQAIEHELKHFVTHAIVDIPHRQNTKVIIAGVISALRSLFTKKGDKMAFVGIEDNTGLSEVAIFSDVYQKSRFCLVKDEILIIEGTVTIDKESGAKKMRAENIYNLAAARERFASHLSIVISKKQEDINLAKKLKEILTQDLPIPGECPVIIDYQNSEFEAQYHLPSDWNVHPTDDLIEALEAVVGTKNATMVW